MMGGDRKFKVVFEPGAFDGFEGTQEELDELMAEITRMAESGELFEQGVLLDELDEETMLRIEEESRSRTSRTLN